MQSQSPVKIKLDEISSTMQVNQNAILYSPTGPGPVQLVLWCQCTGPGLCWRPRDSQMTASASTPRLGGTQQGPGQSRLQATAGSKMMQGDRAV